MEDLRPVDLAPAKEIPQTVATVMLPEIEDPELQVGLRLGMHTDSINTLLKTLYTKPLSRELKIEGRILTPEQEEQLHQNPKFSFYMGSRSFRGSLFFRSELGIDATQVAGLVTSTFEPASLAEELGYETGFIDASHFIAAFLKGRPNDLVGVIGGVNQFRIGSDTLTAGQLAEIVESLRNAWTEQEQLHLAVRPKNIPGFIIPGFSSVPLATLSGLIPDNKKVVDPLKIIKPNNNIIDRTIPKDNTKIRDYDRRY